MKAMNSKKGFTLIELLIVIAIIGVLAVAFLPSLLGAPAKGRDTSRIADLQKIQKVLINGNLESIQYPQASSCIDGAVAPWTAYLPAFGGKAPLDPNGSNVNAKGMACADGKYAYLYQPAGVAGGYTFGLYAKMETVNAGNAKCDKIDDADAVGPVTLEKPDTPANSCYVILTQ